MATPAFDLAAERALLASVLTDPAKWGAAAKVESAMFAADGRHGLIWDTIGELHANGATVDAVTVKAAVAAIHDEPPNMGETWAQWFAALIGERDYTPANAHAYAALVVDYAQRRRTTTMLRDLYEGSMNGQYPNTLPRLLEVADTIGSWGASSTFEDDCLVTDLQPIHNGEGEMIIPNIGVRDDHATCLLYGPGINWLSSEPGMGKSNLAFWWCREEMLKGNRVMYFDYEMSGHGVVARMKAMGVADYSLMTYIRHQGNWSANEMVEVKALVKDLQPTLVVFDAIEGATGAEALNSESNPEIERWVANLPTYCVHQAGSAVLCLDHLPKNPENRGRYPIGAQRKLARADAAFGLDMKEPAGIGTTGRGELKVMKDRWGALSPYTAGTAVASVVITSDYDEDADHYDLAVSLLPPQGVQGQKNPVGRGEKWDPFKYQRGVCETLRDNGGQLTADHLKLIMRKNKGAIDKACLWLARNGYIDRIKGEGNAKPWRLIKMYDLPATPEQVEPAKSFYGD